MVVAPESSRNSVWVKLGALRCCLGFASEREGSAEVFVEGVWLEMVGEWALSASEGARE